MADYNDAMQRIQALRGSLALAADGADLPADVTTLLRVASAALGCVDLCCAPWAAAQIPDDI